MQKSTKSKSKTDSHRGIGTVWEQKAELYLKEQGYEILERNFRSRFGEVDLIARIGSLLVFVEVKYRKNSACGDPLEAVDRKKQRNICQTALFYCAKQKIPDTASCRFDVLAILGNGSFRHLINAFPYLT